MAKAALSSDIDASLKAMAAAVDEIRKKSWSSLTGADIQKYKNTLLKFEMSITNAKQHLATYEQGWSKAKGRLNPFIASGRKQFKDLINGATGADNKLKDVLAALEGVVNAR